MAVEGPLWWQIEHGRYRNTTLKKGSGQYQTQYCTQYSAVDGICGPVTWKMMDTIIRKAQCS